MIRDNRKSIDYFKNYIEYQKDRIRKKRKNYPLAEMIKAKRKGLIYHC